MWATPSVLDELVQEINMLGPRRQITGNGWWLMFSLGVEEAGGEEEDAGKKGGMDGGSG